MNSKVKYLLIALLVFHSPHLFGQEKAPVGKLYFQAIIDWRSGLPEKADKTFKELISSRKDELSPKQQKAIEWQLTRLKECFEKTKEEAEAHLKEALTICQKADTLIFTKESGKQALASLKKAVPLLESAAKHHKDEPLFHLAMAYSLLFSGKPDMAKPSIAILASQVNEGPVHHNLHAMFFRLKKDHESERTHLEYSLRKNKEQPDISFWLSRLLLVHGKKSDRKRAFALALASIENTPHRALYWSKVFKNPKLQTKIDDKAADARASLALTNQRDSGLEATGLLALPALAALSPKGSKSFIFRRNRPVVKIDGPPDANSTATSKVSVEGSYDSYAGGKTENRGSAPVKERSVRRFNPSK